MALSPETIVALVGFSGAILGATVGGLATSLTERWKYKVETRTDAYKSFVDALAKLGVYNGMIGNDGSRLLTPAERDKVIGLLMDFRTAKTKVALYGSPDVMARLGTFSAEHAAIANDADAEAYIAFVEAMRRDSFARDYRGFRDDLDRLMVRDELQVGPDGSRMSLRDRFALAARTAAQGDPAPGSPPPTPPAPPPPGFHTSYSYSTGPKT